MSEERIDIIIEDKVSSGVKDKILGIATAARTAGSAVEKLKQQISQIDVSALSKLADASAKVTNALAREMNAQARLTTATARQATEDAKAAVAKQRLATEAAKTATAEARLATEQQKTAAATAQAQAAATRYEASLVRLKAAQDRAAAGNNALGSGAAGAGNGLAALARQVAGLVGAYIGVREVLAAADAYTTLENKLKTTTDTARQLTAVENELFQIANSTRQPVQETTGAFVRFDTAMKQLGAGQKETLQFTKTLNQAIALSGATTQEAQAGMLQLAQAFGAGKLQGDEFRSIMENLPVVADILAKSLGVTRGELKKMSTDGKLTAEVMRTAFAKAREEIDQKFAKSVPTLAQSMVVLKNNFIQFIGELDKGTGASAALAQAILWVSNNLKLVATAFAVVAGLAIVAFWGQIAAAIGVATGAMWTFTAAIAANPIGLIVVAITAAIAALTYFRDSIFVTGDGITTLGDVMRAVWQIAVEAFNAMWAAAKAFFEPLYNLAKPVIDTIMGWFKNFGEGVDFTFKGLVTAIAKYYDTIIGVGVGAVKAMIAAWNAFPGAFADLIIRAVNAGIKLIESFVNAAIGLLNKLIGAFNAIGDNELTRKLGISFTSLSEIATVSFGEIENTYAGGFGKLGTDTRKAFLDGFNGSNALVNGVNTVFDRATKIANERRDAQRELDAQNARLGDPLRQAGAAAAAPQDEKAAKAAEKRAMALAKINRELDSEIARMGQLKPQREIQQQLDQYENDLASKKIKLTDDERKAIKAKLEAIQQMKLVQQQLDQIYSETIGKQTELTAAVKATSEAYKLGLINATNYQDRMVQLGLQAIDLKLKMGDGSFADALTAGLGKVVSSYQGVMSGLSNAFGDFFTSFSKGFADSIGRAIVYSENLNDALMNVAKQALAQLISALIQVGIQWVANQVLSATLGATATALTATQAAATAAAWAPAAAMASLASFGANAAPAAAALTGTTALAQGLALLKGFESGGYTGNYGRREIAGVVHGKEYVVNADATAKNRGLLEAMNAGMNVRKLVPGYMTGGYVETVPYSGNRVASPPVNEGSARGNRRSNQTNNAPNVTLNIQTKDANSFVQSEAQVAAAMARAVQRGTRNM